MTRNERRDRNSPINERVDVASMTGASRHRIERQLRQQQETDNYGK
jgi:hypothetical protein